MGAVALAVGRRRTLAVVVTLLALASPSARAWNDHGHMMIAAVAYQRLAPGARAQVDRLLALNPDYSIWIANVPPARRGLVAFMLASTWPDTLKHDGRHVNDGYRPVDAAAARNTGYGDDLQHRYWHFIDLPFSADGTPGEPPAEPNAKTQIVAFRTALASDASDELRSYDLVWLLHLVGDVHQPLHCTSRFDRTRPRGDQGGNLLPLCEPPCKDQLHGYWDAVLGTRVDWKSATAEAARLPPPEPRAAAVRDVDVWIRESFDLARSRAYADPPIGLGPGPFTLDAAYERAARRAAMAQAAVAGARLAALLEDALVPRGIARRRAAR